MAYRAVTLEQATTGLHRFFVLSKLSDWRSKVASIQRSDLLIERLNFGFPLVGLCPGNVFAINFNGTETVEVRQAIDTDVTETDLLLMI